MKFLRDEEVVKDNGIVKITMNPISTSVQGLLIGMSSAEKGNDLSTSQVVDRTIYALKNIVKTVEVDGTKYDPIEFAEKADLNDIPTRDVFISIGIMFMEEIYPSNETVKKLGQPLKHGPSGGNAISASDPKTVESPKKDVKKKSR